MYPKRNIFKRETLIIVTVKKLQDLFQKGLKVKLITTFQSRFGPEEWLQPYTDKTLERLPKEGIKKVFSYLPGFASDCVETLEEISIQGRDSFEKSGGKI